MPVSLFMRISDPEIEGSSIQKGFENYFLVSSVNFGAVVAANRTSYTPVTVLVDAFSGPVIMASLSQGKKHTFTISVRKTSVGGGGGGSNVLFETLTLVGTFSGFQYTATEGSDTPMFELSLLASQFNYKQNQGGAEFQR